jgi:hypothetical protein
MQKIINYYSTRDNFNPGATIKVALEGQPDEFGTATIVNLTSGEKETRPMSQMSPLSDKEESDLTLRFGFPNTKETTPWENGIFALIPTGPVQIVEVDEKDNKLIFVVRNIQTGEEFSVTGQKDFRVLPRPTLDALKGDKEPDNKFLLDLRKAYQMIRSRQKEQKKAADAGVSVEDFNKAFTRQEMDKHDPKRFRTIFPTIESLAIVNVNGKVYLLKTIRTMPCGGRLYQKYAKAVEIVRNDDGTLSVGKHVDNLQVVEVRSRKNEERTQYAHNLSRFVPKRVEDKIRALTTVKALVLAIRMGKEDMIKQ